MQFLAQYLQLMAVKMMESRNQKKETVCAPALAFIH
jgi:hypothetical protein